MVRKHIGYLLLATLFSSPLFPSIIKKPPTKQVEVAYADLKCEKEDQEKIQEIISLVAEKSKLRLIAWQSHLKELGAQIDDVHPLKFLSTILKNPYLKGCLQMLWPDSFKRDSFLGGLIPKLSQEADKAKLNQYIEPFAEEVNANPSILKAYFDDRRWEDLVYYLMLS